MVDFSGTKSPGFIGRRHFGLIEDAEARQVFGLREEVILQTQPSIAKAGASAVLVDDIPKNAGGPMEIQLRRETETEATGEIVAVRAATRPLPFEAILSFHDSTLRRVRSV